MSDTGLGPSQPPHGLAGLREIDRAKVHPLVRATAEWSWRLLVIAAAGAVLVMFFDRFETVIVPVALAILGSAMLVPIVDALDRAGLPRSLAVLLALVGAIGALAAVMTFVVEEFIKGVPALVDQVTSTVNDVRRWLIDGPLGLEDKQVGNVGNDFTQFLHNNQDKVTSGALATATTASEIVTGALLTLFLVIFFLYGGGQMWEFMTRAVPVGSRTKVRVAGVAGFGTLVGYVRATVAVALVDAVGIGTGLAILNVPLALPLASLVFLGAFVPIVGALVTGSLAVLVALVTKGWIAAVISAAIVVGVMQLESHVLQPFLLGRSVRLHPVAVVLAIAAGLVSAGIVGGLLAVPIIAFLNTAIRSLYADSRSDGGSDGKDPDADPAGSSGEKSEKKSNEVTGKSLSDKRMYVAEPDEPQWDEFGENPGTAT
ncbi:AI-2E family transporter [Gordonia effusa]|uniref:AI-2E family transporter n=1 Tax=Gordonia effusa TaxID=263908 RepID=UPI001FE09050|nr:AI-2E family transporter [Gordonia effusa]